MVRHHVASNANIKLLDCVIEHEFIYELIFFTRLFQILFIFSYFDAQLS